MDPAGEPGAGEDTVGFNITREPSPKLESGLDVYDNQLAGEIEVDFEEDANGLEQ